MLLTVPVVFSIIASVLLGGSLLNLASLPVRAVGLIVASFAIQVAIYIPALRDSALARQFGALIYIGALTLVLVGVARNLRLGPAVWVLFTGLALNLTVIAANGGHMPTNAAAMRSLHGDAWVRAIAAHQQYGNVQLADHSTRLLPLSDVFPLQMPFGHGNVYSIGDLLIAAGAAGLAYGATRRPWATAGMPERAVAVSPAA